MPRPRTYRNAAERQAAYRQRHPEQRPPREDLLAALARSLHAVLRDAVAAGECAVPPELLGDRSDQTLRNLICYLDPQPHPTRYGADPALEAIRRLREKQTEETRPRA